MTKSELFELLKNFPDEAEIFMMLTQKPVSPLAWYRLLRDPVHYRIEGDEEEKTASEIFLMDES